MPPLPPPAGPPPSLPPVLLDTLPPRDYIHLKVVTIGNSCCGKSCLIKRYCEKKFIPKYISTIGLDFGVRHTPPPPTHSLTAPTAATGTDSVGMLKLNFFDLSGAGYYGGLRRGFYSGCQLLLLCFDVNTRLSFTALPQWLAEAREAGGVEGAVVCVCGCMSGEEGLEDDAEGGGGMSSTRKRQVTEAEARVWSESRGHLYYELSAKTGKGVEEMFDAALQALVKQLKLM